jgi:FAD/FMN-containing dehydrogenase
MHEYALRPAIMEGLKAHLCGELICSNDRRYDTTRKVWNGMIDKYPALIVRCADVVDVVTAVQFARAHHLLVAVRSGGHSVSGSSVCDGGIVIDLSCMKGARAVYQQWGLCQLPGPGGRGTGASRIRGQLRAAGGPQEQV